MGGATTNGATNGVNGVNHPVLKRADETEDLLGAVHGLLIDFIRAADEAAPLKASGNASVTANGETRSALVESLKPEALLKRFAFELPDDAQGKDGLVDLVSKVLKYSVNTWDQGFLDKLYATSTPVGVVSDLLLSVLNTNLHVYQVSPALTLIEKLTARKFAGLYGFTGPRAGGIVCQGGSSSNLTSLVIARGALYPDTKASGNARHDFALFTSSHGHYSVEKAAVTCGMGNACTRGIPVDENGCMKPSALRDAVIQAKSEGKTPLYVNATAGTTVMGSFDPFEEIHAICKEYGMWMHVDGSWGGPTIFSTKQRHKLRGAHLADSLTVNPHKMLNVPVTCSFLLTNDLSRFHKANTLPAGYLFHSIDPEAEVWDLADLTLQCGRRGDAVKLALAWTYYGAEGFERQIDGAFETAAHLASIVKANPDLALVSSDPPPCLQVCFYHAPGGKVPEEKEVNTARTREIVRRMVGRGFMVDYAPGPKGSFFRVVVNTQTLKGTVEGLVKAVLEEGKEVV